MHSQKIRRAFLQYFKDKGHTIVPSSPVVPHDDPTLLFCNAGMNQFKDVFLGKSACDYKRAADSQKCVRVGGKHNDLENVGHTSRHLTFFEMLGNFSFGDYFKAEAIQFAWEVSTDVFQLEVEKLWVSVFREDDEAFELWTKYLPAERIVRLGEKENFWSMGDTGPCGPCSELLYDRGEAFGNMPSPYEDLDGERYPEFWNLVFMEFNRDHSGKLSPLPARNIDTGAGLERILAMKGGHDTVFETDVIRTLIGQVEKLSNKSYNAREMKEAAPFRVIADHLRCLAFAIADGVQPSNVDRGYVVRKVLRRAVRYGRQLGMQKPFLAELVPTLVETMGEDFREIVTAQSRIEEIVTLEEEAFLRTLSRGGNLLSQVVEEARQKGDQITGDDAFKLKDTYGLPLEEILLLAKDGNLSVDLDRYQHLEQEARDRSRAVHKKTSQVAEEGIFQDLDPTTFVGFGETAGKGKIVALVRDGQRVEKLEAGQEGMVVLDQTPFYAEKGGQIGDTGKLGEFDVSDCQEPYTGITAHIGTLERGTLQVGDALEAIVDADRRKRITHNHTATHLLHWALQEILGEHIKQAGSIVASERLRFDFSHHKALTQEEIRQIEDLINTKIRENLPVESYELSYTDAQKRSDIKQFFGEKYGTTVRVVDIDYSKELCGGCHTARTGDIGAFVIAEERSIAAGVRRIVAVTGPEALDHQRGLEDLIGDIASLLKTQPQKVLERLNSLLEENSNLSHEIRQAKAAQVSALAAELEPESVGEISLITAQVDLEPAQLRELADSLLQRHPSAIIILGAASADRASLVARVSEEMIGKGVKAGELIKKLAPTIGGGGGGKADFAQAGGKQPAQLKQALAEARELVGQL